MLDRVINTVFPPRCIFCGKLLMVSSKIHICSSCYGRIPFADTGSARSTGRQRGSDCDEILFVCEYAGIIKESLIKYKFFGRPSFYRTFAALMGDKVRGLMERHKFDMIISVPLHKSRERERGFNQSRLLSKALSRETGIRECSGLLTRVKNTDSQSLLGKNSRRVNIIDAFKITSPEKISNKNILIIDDIFTTGSTLNECSKVLKKAGAARVAAAVLASGRKF